MESHEDVDYDLGRLCLRCCETLFLFVMQGIPAVLMALRAVEDDAAAVNPRPA